MDQIVDIEQMFVSSFRSGAALPNQSVLRPLGSVLV